MTGERRGTMILAQRNTRVRFTALRSSAMAQPVAGPAAPIERPHLRSLDRAAADALIPYAAWFAFATILNAEIARLNPQEG